MAFVAGVLIDVIKKFEAVVLSISRHTRALAERRGPFCFCEIDERPRARSEILRSDAGKAENSKKLAQDNKRGNSPLRTFQLDGRQTSIEGRSSP
jgi:hypothetical protein